MSFEDPRLLWLALALPAMVGLGVWGWTVRRRRAAEALGSPGLLARLGAGDLQHLPLARLFLLCLAAAALGVAAAGPRWGLESVEEETIAGDLVLALDVSRSMLASDIEPDRMERQRVLARRVLQGLPGDRIGLVVFAGRAFVLTPLTTDHSVLHLHLDGLDPDMVTQGGSTLSAALRQATDVARGPHDVGRGTVLFVSDGEALEERGAVLRAADRAERLGIVVHTVGVGTRDGAPVPARPGPDGRVVGYTHDPDGGIVISRLDDELLREVARRTGGRYFALGQAGSTDALIRTLQGLDRTEGDPRSGVRPRPRHAWFVLLALALLAVDGTFAPGRRRAAPGPARPGSGGRNASARARPPRRSPARAVLVLALAVVTSGAVFAGIERGNRLYRAGQVAEAVEAYRAALGTRADGPVLRYNLGTALLRLGRFAEAEEYLLSALDQVAPEDVGLVHYNLGQRFLEDARASHDPAAAGPLYEAAVEAYRQALRHRPGDGHAKWNYELALRERDEQQALAGETDHEPEDLDRDPEEGDEDAGGGAGSPGSPDPPAPRGGGEDQAPMTREQAERILSAIEQDERELMRERLRQGPRQPPPARDW